MHPVPRRARIPDSRSRIRAGWPSTKAGTSSWPTVRPDVFTPGTAKPTRTFGTLSAAGFITFNKARTDLYVSDTGANQIDEFDYATGKIKSTIELSDAAGLAIDPPAPL